jgi:crotonobetainyl-CoA:carnitine CoA-transferase CaiB-like acyl-CoA transferase
VVTSTGRGNAVAGAFEGLDVLELASGIAGPMVGMMLADHGAVVTRIERPGDPLADFPGCRVWNRGKRSALLDLRDPEDHEVLVALIERADVLLDSLPPGAMERLGLAPVQLQALNPRLISCSVTAYGENNEHSARPGYEALVAARTGAQWAQRGGIMSNGELGVPDIPIPEGAEQAARAEGPIFSASPWMSLNGFYAATLAIAAALLARERTGAGQHIEASMLPRASFVPALPDGGATGGTWMNLRGAPRGLFECKDRRWVHQWPIKPLSIVQAAEHERLEDAPPPEYTHRRVDPSRIGMEPENIVVLFHYLPLMQEAFKKFPAEDWRRWGERVQEGVQIVRSPEEALADPTLLEDGVVVEVRDPDLGAIRHLGVLNDLSASPGAVRGPAPRRGEHSEEVRNAASSPVLGVGTSSDPGQGVTPGEPPSGSPVGDEPPLRGVRILDIGLALAGPYGSSLLADLGADVIKINAPWDGAWLATGIGQLANHGKRSVLLNLGKPNGLAAFYELVKTADVVTHNMRWGVAERIGVGYDDLRAVNPSIIYAASRGFDRARSAANLPGTDQSASALAGQEWEDGGCGRGGRPFFGTSFGDLGNGFLVAIGILVALYHRQRTGEGQEAGCSILGACLATSSGTFAYPDGSGPDRARLDPLQLGFSALYRLYETADGWLCLAAVTEAHWAALCCALGRDELVADGRFADPADRTANDDDLGKLLGEVLRTRDASAWWTVLDEAGVPAEVSRPGFDSGALRRPYLEFSATPAARIGFAPRLGAHTDEVLDELHLTADVRAAVHAECADRARA